METLVCLFSFALQDGIDYAATTIQSNYERIPFLFTVKDLVAKASSGGNQVKPGFQMGGGFRTPSYRTGLFLDPKGRGGSTGYDMAVALPGLQSGVEGDKEMFKENNKVFDVTDGNIEFEVNQVDKEAGEIGGEKRGQGMDVGRCGWWCGWGEGVVFVCLCKAVFFKGGGGGQGKGWFFVLDGRGGPKDVWGNGSSKRWRVRSLALRLTPTRFYMFLFLFSRCLCLTLDKSVCRLSC